MKKLLAMVLCLSLMAGLAAAGFASGEPDKVSGAPSGEKASGEPTTEEQAGPKAAIVISDAGEDAAQEQTEGFDLSFYAGGAKTDAGLSGFLFTSDDPAAALLYSELSEDSGGFYTLGGAGRNVTPAALGVSLTQEAVDWVSALGTDSFDSAVILTTDTEESCLPVISAKGYTYLNIANMVLYDEGDARSAFYSDVVGGSTVPGPGSGGGGSGVQTPVVVISNSLLETAGTGDVEGAVSVGNSGGRARGIQPQGKSVTYLYNSAIVSHTWGAWSTDSARQSLDLIAYQSMGLSQNGYGAYADTSCRLFLYGSVLMGASDGVVASNDGEIYAVASDSAENSTALRALMGKDGNPRDLSYTDYFDADYSNGSSNVSAIIGGQTAVQFHMPDQGHSGAKNTKKATLFMQGGALVTDESLVAGASDAYHDRYAGACLVTKSTQANIVLDGVTMTSWSGELVHCMINSDTNVNAIADGDTAPGSDFTFRGMDVTGDIVHDDYQRALRLTLSGTTLTGAIYSNTCADWNALCEAEFDGEYILDPDGYSTLWGVELTLENGAVWNVTETSVVTGLTVGDGCAVNGVVTKNSDGSFTVAPLAGADAGEDMDITVNGQPFGSFDAGESQNADGYSVSLGSLLDALGLTVSFDEQSGTVTVQDKSGILGALLGGD